MDVRVDEPEQSPKDMMSQVVGIAEEVAQAVEAITTEAKEEGQEPSQIDLSFREIFLALASDKTASEDLSQMIACVPNPDSKVEQTWDVHEAYCFGKIGCIDGHNLSGDNFHSLKGNELHDNFVSPTDVHH